MTELPRERLQRGLERPAAGDVELEAGHLLARLGERPQQDDVSLDRDQPADAEEPRHRRPRTGRLAVRRDPVVDDLEARLVEALGIREVAREAPRDRDVDVREAGDGAVAERERAALAELVEAVLRREAHRHARERAGHLAVRVGVDEVRVQDPRTVAAR